MLQCIVNITIQQVSDTDNNGDDNGRSKTFYIPFCNSYEVYSSWKNLSDTAVVEIPKNVYVTDENGEQVVWGDSTTADKQNGYINAGGFDNDEVSSPPLIMRGDMVTIEAGYSYISQVNLDGSLNYHTETHTLFQGFVSALEMKSSIRIHCEDNMWMLKQTGMTDKTYGGDVSNDISDVLDDIVTQVNLIYPDNQISDDTYQFSLSVGNFSTAENETAADVLNKLKKLMPSMGFYFRGNVLRGGGIVYFPSDQSTGTDSDGNPLYPSFNFQRNIISDALTYSQKSDINIGAKCYSINSATDSDNPTQNKMGVDQYTTKRLEVSVGDDNQGNADAYEYYTFYFRDITDEDDLMQKGQTYLNRYHYDGFRGKFKTFGLPFVQHGNIIYLTDDILPERDGHYMVKGVHYTYGIESGMRQEIELHFRTDNIDDDILSSGM
ncbi:MAG TPA: hypothetical protein VK809_09765 [Bacteroidia bacterium]|jgi:hypothetical protein|nr:hypothetical protein [Bacteroidia bacterium]